MAEDNESVALSHESLGATLEHNWKKVPHQEIVYGPESKAEYFTHD